MLKNFFNSRPSDLRLHFRSWLTGCVILFLLNTLLFPIQRQEGPEEETGVYFPSNCLTGRTFQGIVHYMQAANLNLAVLHAKDPNGRLYWRSENQLALNIGAVSGKNGIETAVTFLKQSNIRSAAKLDVFQDSLLVMNHPEMGVMDSETGELWADHKGLHWANPYDRRVWDYIVDLSLELIEIGIDEIQFDYIRFPSDGDLSTIEYPNQPEGISPEQCIGDFLAYAESRLKPKGVVISVDLFGITAWKFDDFGVGQVLERIAPHVDVICPMLYPSHFPDNFLDFEDPGRYPYEIMKLSLEEMKKRTDKKIRPWIQGFWYSPDKINAQLSGAEETGIRSWTIWHPSGKYGDTFDALELRSGNTFAEPLFYPSLEELRTLDERIIQGQSNVINYTCFREGYSILSLDQAAGSRKNEYATLLEVIPCLDESVIDYILLRRGVTFSQWTGSYAKAMWITELIIQDLDIDPSRMSPAPIYIEWDGDAVFSLEVPEGRHEPYERLGDKLSDDTPEIRR